MTFRSTLGAASLIVLTMTAGLTHAQAPTSSFAARAGQRPANASGRDSFYWLSELNKASNVMIVETGIVSPELGRTIATSVAKVIADADQDPKLRSGDYLTVEPRIIAVGGPDVTRLHSGRSRQDIGSTTRRLFQRDQVLVTADSLNRTRKALLDLAAQNPDAIVPAYTWGVQAQPISFGHWMLAYGEALEHQAAALRTAFASANRSPFGSAALGTSSFPVDRRRLSELLGFDGPMVNSLYANQISPIETGADLSASAVGIALITSSFTTDIESQYRMATPWLILKEGELTGVSSIMPQKRNPAAITAIHSAASGVLGEATTFYFQAHGVAPGMGDYKGEEPERALAQTAAMLNNLTSVLQQLVFNPDRSLAEVNADYSATTELADILQREANVPFRIGHHFASQLVTFGRGAGLKPSEIKYADAQRIYKASAEAAGVKDTRLPLSEAEFRRALSAENMVRSSKGLGGPQPAEVARMLAEQRAHLAADEAWVRDTRGKLDQASRALDGAFDRLRQGS